MSNSSSIKSSFYQGLSPKDRELADDFISRCQDFHLGKLTTETPDVLSSQLSDLSQTNIDAAIDLIKEIDLRIFKVLREKSVEIAAMSKTIRETIESGGKIYLAGCGATGRLSLSLEALWRFNCKQKQSASYADSLVSFMAGGDVAIISSVEKFEDYPEFGARQLMELNYSKTDLLIACTEGGETPFVIGTTKKAREIGLRAPYFLYCNPDEELKKYVKRSKEVLVDEGIRKINLCVGPMALTGSTRMQASTILMAAVGFALESAFNDNDKMILDEQINSLEVKYKKLSMNDLMPFILKEASILSASNQVLYSTNAEIAICLLTDTTERSPTFSLPSFENQNDQNKISSPVYLFLAKEKNNKDAWAKMLGDRAPRTFHWPEVTDITGLDRLMGFEISANFLSTRKRAPEIFLIELVAREGKNFLHFHLQDLKLFWEVSAFNLLEIHLVLKMAMNILSTIVMGNLGRYDGNLMTWVKPSNNKLIDRAVRYAQILIEKEAMGHRADYNDLVYLLMGNKDQLNGQSLVRVMVSKYLEKKQ